MYFHVSPSRVYWPDDSKTQITGLKILADWDFYLSLFEWPSAIFITYWNQNIYMWVRRRNPKWSLGGTH